MACDKLSLLLCMAGSASRRKGQHTRAQSCQACRSRGVTSGLRVIEIIRAAYHRCHDCFTAARRCKVAVWGCNRSKINTHKTHERLCTTTLRQHSPGPGYDATHCPSASKMTTSVSEIQTSFNHGRTLLSTVETQRIRSSNGLSCVV